MVDYLEEVDEMEAIWETVEAMAIWAEMLPEVGMLQEVGAEVDELVQETVVEQSQCTILEIPHSRSLHSETRYTCFVNRIFCLCLHRNT